MWNFSDLACHGGGNRCKAIPLVFTLGGSKANCTTPEYKPQPCPEVENVAISVFYYDWNVQKCQGSHFEICSGTEEAIFNGTFNAFPTQWDCMQGKSDKRLAFFNLISFKSKS